MTLCSFVISADLQENISEIYKKVLDNIICLARATDGVGFYRMVFVIC